MQNYKDVCGNEEKVWFEISETEGQEFLQWAKDLGCSWLNGNEIIPENGTDGRHFSIHNDGKLAHVAMFIWTDKRTENIIRYSFSEYMKGNKTPIKNQCKLTKFIIENEWTVRYK